MSMDVFVFSFEKELLMNGRMGNNISNFDKNEGTIVFFT